MIIEGNRKAKDTKIWLIFEICPHINLELILK